MELVWEYIKGYDPLVWFYLFSTMITSIACGLFFKKHQIFMQDRMGCFLGGISFCPCLQYLFTLCVTPFINGRSRYYYIILLPAVSLLWIIYYVMKLGKEGGGIEFKYERIKRSFRFKKIPVIISVIVLGISVSCLVYYFLRAATSSSFVTSDNLEYFLKASYFADNRTLSSISYINGVEDGSGVADHHFPSYILYLGYAFMHTTSPEIIFPHHAAALIAAFFQLPFLLAGAMSGLCAVIRRKSCLFWIPALLFGNKLFASQIWNSTRDYFRFTLLFLFIGMLMGLEENTNVKAKGYKLKIIFFMLLSFACASAHLLNFVYVCLLLAAWGTYRLINMVCQAGDKQLKGYRREGVLVSGSLLAAGLSFGGNIYYFFKSGKWGAQRLDISKYDFYEEYTRLINKGKVEFPSLKERLISSLQLDESVFSYIFITLAIIVLVGYVVRRLRCKSLLGKQENKILFLALCVIYTFFPLSGIIDHEDIYLFSVYFGQHPRYGLPFFLSGSLLLLTVVSELECIIRATKRKICIFCLSFIISGMCIYMLCEYKNTIEYYRDQFSNHVAGDVKFLENYGELRQIIFSLDSKRVLSTQQIGYVLDRKNIQHLSPITKPIYEAKNDEQLKQAFKELEIGAAVLPCNITKESAMALMPWFDYVTRFPSTTCGNYDVYYLE